MAFSHSQVHFEALTYPGEDEYTSLPSDEAEFDWDQHLRLTRIWAVSPHRFSSVPPTIAELKKRPSGVMSAPPTLDSTTDRKGWYRSSGSINKLQRSSSAQARRPSTASSFDPATLTRKSPIHFEENYTVPAPPSLITTHPAHRPTAARNASDGTGRKSSVSLDIPRPSSSVSRRLSSGTRPSSRNHPALPAARSIRQRVARAATPNPSKPFPTPPNTVQLAVPQPLPVLWTTAHDRAICVLDTRNYTTDRSIRKLRRAFPELSGCHLSPTMVERRLRVLDQIPEIDYFSVGLMTEGNPGRTSSESQRHRQSGARNHARLDDRFPSLSNSSAGDTISTRSGHSGFSDDAPSSGSPSAPHPIRAGRASRRRAGSVLGLAGNESSLGKAGRPMSIIDERPGSVLGNEGVETVTRLVSDEEDVARLAGTEKSIVGKQPRLMLSKDGTWDRDEKENEGRSTGSMMDRQTKLGKKVNGLRKLAVRSPVKLRSGGSVGAEKEQRTGQGRDHEAHSIGRAI